MNKGKLILAALLIASAYGQNQTAPVKYGNSRQDGINQENQRHDEVNLQIANRRVDARTKLLNEQEECRLKGSDGYVQCMREASRRNTDELSRIQMDQNTEDGQHAKNINAILAHWKAAGDPAPGRTP
jgi:hypothetical protein